MILRVFLLSLLLFSIATRGFSKEKKLHLQHKITSQSNHSIRISHRTKLKDSVDIVAELNMIIEELQKKRYLLASIDSTVYSGFNVTAYIHVGKQFKKASISVDSSLFDALLDVNLSPRKQLSLKEYLDKRKQIIQYFENKGYPFAELFLENITVDTNAVYATLNCNKYQKWIISDISFTGNAEISPRYIYNEIQIFPNSIYSEKNIKAIPERIQSLPFIELSRAPEIEFHKNGTVKILLEINKTRSNSFDGIIGFAPDPQNDDEIVMTGNINMSLQNSLHVGESFSLEWEKLDPYSQNLQAGTYFKYIVGTRIGAGANIKIEKQDSTFVNTHIASNLDYYLYNNSSVGLMYQRWQNNLIQDNAYDSITNSINNLGSQTNLYGFQYRYAKVDYMLNPSKGILLKSNISSGFKKYNQPTSVPDSAFTEYNSPNRVIEGEFQANIFIPISSVFVCMIGSQNKYLHGESMFENEMYKIGGANSLRGFNEKSIYASAYSINTIELRLLFDKQSNLYAFYDQAYYQNNSVSENLSDTPYGFGLGMDISNKNSVFRISYALGKQFDNPILFTNGKVHFGYSNRF